MEVERKLGNGAFGVTYKVEDETSSREYALKDILCKNDNQIKNAIREVETMTQISHENVISMIDAEQFRDQRYKLHMTLCDKCLQILKFPKLSVFLTMSLWMPIIISSFKGKFVC